MPDFCRHLNTKMKKKSMKNTFGQTFTTTKYMFDMVWRERIGKEYIFLKSVMALVNALFPMVYIIMPGLIINELTDSRQIERIVCYVAVLTLAPVVSQLLGLAASKRTETINLKLGLKFTEDFYAHALHMDYETLEKPDIQVLKNRAGTAMDGVLNVVNQLSSLLLAAFSLIALSSIISMLNPIIIVLIVCIIFINSRVTKRVNQIRHRLEQDLSRYDWVQGSYSYMLEYFIFAKEIRLFRIQSLLIGLFSKSKTDSNKLELKWRLSGNKLSLMQSATNFIQQAALYAYLVYCVFLKGLPIGSMTIYLSAASQFSGALSNVFNAYLKLVDQGQKTKELMEFMDIPLRQQESGTKIPEYNSQSVIEFRDVSFRYPGSERYALRHLNLTIHANEKLCIVGVNGSGKTTFVKLLTRLYFPTEGDIFLNGINIKEYDYEAYQRLFAPVFQDFCTFSMSLGENIYLAGERDDAKLRKVCEESGIQTLVEKLPKGYDTLVDKNLDEEGVDLSGGEGQRMAIARACYHGGEIFLLDEPTAALDPVAEYEIYMQFNNIITDKTAVLITHRLAAVKLADRVAVFDDGKLAEYGTHMELYQKGGIYTEMFDKQALFYREETSKEDEQQL